MKPLPPSSYHGDDWFFHHFGFIESVEDVRQQMKAKASPDHTELVSDIANRRLYIEQFYLRSPASFQSFHPSGGGKFHIIHGHGVLGINDIVVIQNDPLFSGVTFLVESNFNCLEFSSHLCSASNGIRGYAVDSTQGPVAACPSPGARMSRNYFGPHHETDIGQIETAINLLERTPIRVVHGKAMKSEYKSTILAAWDLAQKYPGRPGSNLFLHSLEEDFSVPQSK